MKRRIRGVPQEPDYEIGLNAEFALDDPPLRARSFIEWCRDRLGIAKCTSVEAVQEVRRSRAALAAQQRELIAKIDDALVIAEALYRNRTAGEICAVRSDGSQLDPNEEILDLVVGHLDQALWLERQRLKRRELRAPIRQDGSPPRMDLDLFSVTQEATGLAFAEVVRRVYDRLENDHGQRDTFVADETRALQKARQRRRKNQLDETGSVPGGDASRRSCDEG